MSAYTLDSNAAKQADSINSKIDHSGKYSGTFTRAEPTSEIMNRSTNPETADKMLAVLKDKPMKPSNVTAPPSQHSCAPQSGDSFSDFESDIPF